MKNYKIYYLLIPYGWCYEEISFAFEARFHASTNGILKPSLIKIVGNMCISMTNPNKLICLLIGVSDIAYYYFVF